MGEATFDLFAVRNREGKWFRRKGYGGTGDSWVEEFARARIYTKIGPARGVVSFFANTYPEYGVPDLIRLTCTATAVESEGERVKKVKAAKEFREAKWDAYRKKQALESARAEAEEAKRRYDALRA
jgi:hypothetical protein